MKKEEYEAHLLHKDYPKSDPYGSLSMPVYHTLAYEFATAAEMEDAFCGRTAEHTYSRVTNPTVQHFEERVKEITGAYGVTALNSGMAAVSNTFFTWRGAVVTSSPHATFWQHLLFLRQYTGGLRCEVRFCDLTNPEEVAAHIDGQSCALFAEVISNPQMEVVDLMALSRVAQGKGVPLVADTTLIPFSHFTASSFGVDMKWYQYQYVSGGGTSLGD